MVTKHRKNVAQLEEHAHCMLLNDEQQGLFEAGIKLPCETYIGYCPDCPWFIDNLV